MLLHTASTVTVYETKIGGQLRSLISPLRVRSPISLASRHTSRARSFSSTLLLCKLDTVDARIAAFLNNSSSRNKILCPSCEMMLQKVESTSAFCNKILICCSYYRTLSINCSYLQSAEKLREGPQQTTRLKYKMVPLS